MSSENIPKWFAAILLSLLGGFALICMSWAGWVSLTLVSQGNMLVAIQASVVQVQASFTQAQQHELRIQQLSHEVGTLNDRMTKVERKATSP